MFYERYWHDRTGVKLKDFELKWPKISRFIPRQKECTILDLGCGNGEILKEMRTLNPHAKYIGLDVSQKAIDEGATKLPGVRFDQIMDGGKFPLADESIDFIFSSEVIEHVYDVENYISEAYRVLRQGGTLLLTTPYHGFIKNLLIIASFKFDSHFDPLGPHIRFFTKHSILSLLEKSRLVPTHFGYFGRFYPIPHCLYVVAEKKSFQ